jgi:signal transduction histidine kinase
MPQPSTGRAVSGWWVLPALVVVLAGTTASNLHDGGSAAGSAALAGLATLSLLLAGRDPVAAVLVNAGLIGAYFGLGFADGPAFLTVPAAVFLLAVQRPTRQWLPPAVGALLLVAGGLVVRGVWWDDGLEKSLWQSLGVAAMISVAGAVGAAVRSRRQAKAESAQRAVAEEQLRMAQDLHDGVGHGLAVVAMQSGVVLHLLDKPDIDRDAARRAVQAIRDTSRESLEALRAELARMAPGAPAARSPRRGVGELPVLVDRIRAGGLSVELEASHGALPAPVSETAYVVVQEALTNVLKHASAAKAKVEVRAQDDAVLVAVIDDGVGDVVVDGLGLSGMRARVEQLGGSVTVGRTADGFAVRARLPLGTPA